MNIPKSETYTTGVVGRRVLSYSQPFLAQPSRIFHLRSAPRTDRRSKEEFHPRWWRAVKLASSNTMNADETSQCSMPSITICAS